MPVLLSCFFENQCQRPVLVKWYDGYIVYVLLDWGIENSLHWCLEVNFNEDACRMSVDNSGANLTVIRHIATNLNQLDCIVNNGAILCQIMYNKFRKSKKAKKGTKFVVIGKMELQHNITERRQQTISKEIIQLQHFDL